MTLAQLPLFRFDGRTFQYDRDSPRLSRQLIAVIEVMRDGEWHTLPEIAQRVGASPQSVSARLRDLRKERFGCHEVERVYVANGLFMYRVHFRLALSGKDSAAAEERDQG